MSQLDQAMEEQMAHLVFEEHRPFSYRDFLRFEIAGKEYTMAHGTFRNKVSRLVKEGTVELAYNSGPSFYTLSGIRFSKPMTPDHTGAVSQTHPICKLIQGHPMDKSALHDIRLKFTVKGIWFVISTNHKEFPVNTVSKDIRLPSWKVKDLFIRVTVHRTDTVSVIIGCSYSPVATDVNGIIRLSSALARIEEKITVLISANSLSQGNGMINDTAGESGNGEVLVVPEYIEWLVTMWHFGADASIEYTGEKFSTTWQVGERELVRIYSKDFRGALCKDGSRTRGKTRLRCELQEYPMLTVEDTIRKIVKNSSGCSFDDADA
jgi:hypothetical protein